MTRRIIISNSPTPISTNKQVPILGICLFFCQKPTALLTDDFANTYWQVARDHSRSYSCLSYYRMLLLFGLGLSDAYQGMSSDHIIGQQPKNPKSTRLPYTLTQ